MSEPKVRRFQLFSGLFGGIYRDLQGHWCVYTEADKRYRELGAKLKAAEQQVTVISKFMDTMNTDAGRDGGYYTEFAETVHEMVNDLQASLEEK